MSEKDLIPAVSGGVPPDEEMSSLSQFEFWLKDLAGCSSWLINIIMLDHTGMDVLAADDSEAYFFKFQCDHAARSRVDKAINEAQEKMAARTHAPEDGSVYQSFKRHFDARLDDLKKRLEAIRTLENSAIVDEMELYMTASKIHAKAKKISDSLTGVYPLRDSGDYYAQISYDAYDPSAGETGLAWLIAKGFIRYGFDCFEAVRGIEEDAGAALNKFQADFNAQIQGEILVNIVEPIQALLPQLRAKTAQLSA